MDTRSRRDGRLSSALLLALSLLACGRTPLEPKPVPCVFDRDCAPGLRCVNQECIELDLGDGGRRRGTKRFGEPCAQSLECASGYCVGGPTGDFCTEACGADAGSCPTSYACKSVEDPRERRDAGARARVSLCAVPQPLLCQACTDDGDCGASTGDRCLSLAGGRFCGRDCSFEGCPPQYSCEPQADGRRQCTPQGKTCDCVAQTLGLQKACRKANAVGACPGAQVCQGDGGFTPCDAIDAIPESCNGVDDDCNGRIDDFDAGSCVNTSGMLRCAGRNVCLATAGLLCAAPVPAGETCNLADDDCNGVVDDGFVDSAGRYTQRANCGGCGNDCNALVSNATATTCVLDAAGAPGCRATACAAGFVTLDEGRSCVALTDTLCRSCASDRDCAGPGARCLTVDGQKVCARDCSPGNPNGACPSGYSCAAQPGGGAQCVPANGTCNCQLSSLGARRTCTLSTCRGFEVCAASGASAAWSACDVASYNPEICDQKDNNCDGRTDEGFVNAGTGRYDRAEHCGFCNNDCTKRFSPTLQHANGVCNATLPMPACELGPCLTETVGATTFEWVNVNGAIADGCECRRVQGNTANDLPDRLPASGTAASWVDENCDGIDGVLGDAVFVSTTAPAGGNGTRTAPLRTLAQGLAAQQAQGKRYVLVAQGVYRESLLLFEGAQLFGGYSPDFLKRDPNLHTVTIQGLAPVAGGAQGTVHLEGLGNGAAQTVVSGFTILGPDITAPTPEGQAGAASIALYAKDVGPNVVVSANTLVAGRGGRGGRGATGAQGAGRQSAMGLNGAAGVDAQEITFGSCTPALHRSGGAAGLNPACPSANGNPGGNVVCPAYLMAAFTGAQQAYVSPTNGNGRGGWDWSFDMVSGNQCGHVTESGWPSSIQSHDGADGAQGADGVAGSGGAGAPARARSGSLSAGRWVPGTSGALPGAPGAFGKGGGGGGAGGGVAQFLAGGCQSFELGATGGGGGAGACGGTGGGVGGAGGGSFTVFLTYTNATALAQAARIVGNRLQRGLGGDGGAGGFGGAGGLGGAAGFGGNAARWSSSTGGKGGEGGNGGSGGGGGGGAGGPSFAIFTFNVSSAALQAANALLTPAGLPTGGQGGAGGSAPGSGSTGTDGTRGGAGHSLSFSPCTAGCPPSTSCDGNNVCVPD